MSTIKFIASCLLDFAVAVFGSVYRLFDPIDIPELDEHTEAFYHKIY